MGESANENSDGIAVDLTGNACVTGWTLSTHFPATAGSADTSYNGAGDIFVTKLNSGGNALDYSAYLGGANYDFAHGICVDSFGNAYVGGLTGSSNFPTTEGAYDPTFNGWDEVFATKISADGSDLGFPTLGGAAWHDSGADIAVYLVGNVTSQGIPPTQRVPPRPALGIRHSTENMTS
jgi:hypothetical protein